MAALTIERLTPCAGVVPSRGTAKIAANTRIFKGAMVALDSAGRAVPGGTVAGGATQALGVASATFNNLTGSEAGGAADALDVEVEYGVFGFKSGTAGDEILADDVGKVAYMIDDQTVGLTDGGAGARSPAGVITEVRDGLVWLWVGPHVSALISGATL